MALEEKGLDDGDAVRAATSPTLAAGVRPTMSASPTEARHGSMAYAIYTPSIPASIRAPPLRRLTMSDSQQLPD